METIMISLAEAGVFGCWIIDNYKKTNENNWQNIHTSEIVNTIEELYLIFKKQKK